MKQDIEHLDKSGLRKFGLVTGAIVALLFGLLLPWLFSHDLPHWPWYVAGTLWALAIIFPLALNPVYHVWMRFGLVAGWINTRIILGIIFYTLFTPISLMLTISRKDPMRRKMEPGAESYRVITRTYPKEHMERPY